MTASNKTTDDFVIDDNVETHRKKRRHRDEDSRKEHSKQIAGKIYYAHKIELDYIIFNGF